MKKLLLCGVMCIATTPAIAETMFVDAPVVSVNQLYKASEVRTPVQNCSQQLVPYKKGGQNFGIGNIIGGVVGGLLGNQVGKGRGKTAATVDFLAPGQFTYDPISNTVFEKTKDGELRRLNPINLEPLEKVDGTES